MTYQKAELHLDLSNIEKERTMKTRSSVKPMCDKCKVIKRKGRVAVIKSEAKRS